MKTEKLVQIVESYLNGNISDTKKAVKTMSKLDMIDFLEALAANMPRHEAVQKLRNLLS